MFMVENHLYTLVMTLIRKKLLRSSNKSIAMTFLAVNLFALIEIQFLSNPQLCHNGRSEFESQPDNF